MNAKQFKAIAAKTDAALTTAIDSARATYDHAGLNDATKTVVGDYLKALIKERQHRIILQKEEVTK